MIPAVTAIHIAAGTLALALAPLALLARKGGRWHALWGRAFALGMAGVLATSSAMWEAKGHVFLLALTFVCAYLVLSGYRIVLLHRRRAPDARGDGVDIAAACVAGGAGLWLLAIAWAGRGDAVAQLAPIVAALGVVAIAFALNDLRGFLRPRTRLGFQLAHICAMVGAFVAAVTAFVVINAHGVPMALRWIVPSGLGTVLIAGYSIRYRWPYVRRALLARRAVRSARRAASTTAPLDTRGSRRRTL